MIKKNVLQADLAVHYSHWQLKTKSMIHSGWKQNCLNLSAADDILDSHKVIIVTADSTQNDGDIQELLGFCLSAIRILWVLFHDLDYASPPAFCCLLQSRFVKW